MASDTPLLHATLSSALHPALRGIPKLNNGTLWIESTSRDALDTFRALPERGLAIVGSRAPQMKSRLLLERTMKSLEGSNLVIISGLARGIDADAHRWALDMGLKTVGVLGHGFQYHYPDETAPLRKEILERGGLIVSEYPPEKEPRPYQFIHRNRIIAALAKAVWVVQAGKHSGALNTAKWARDFDRDLYVTPCFPGDSMLVGNQTLLEDPRAMPLWDAECLSTSWLELLAHVQTIESSYH